MFLSYAFCEKLWKTCRSKARGKPIRKVHTGARLYFDQFTKAFSVHVYREVLAHVHPNNTLQMVAMPSGQSAQYTYARAWNISTRYVKRNMYRVDMNRRPSGIDAQSPYWTPNLTLDLNTGRFVNAQPDPVRVVDADKNRQWQRTLRNYSRLWTVACKVGVAENVMEEARYLSDLPYGNPERAAVFTRIIDAKELIAYMEAEDVSPRTMLHIVACTRYGHMWQHFGRYSYSNYATDLKDAFRRLYATMRDEVRREVGCFTE